MKVPGFSERPARPGYDVVILGAGIMGTAAAWFLASDPGFDGRVLVIERDPSFAAAATSLTNSCVRQQFSNPVNIRISQFTLAYLKEFRTRLGGDPEVPEIHLDDFGYLYLAASEAGAAALRANHAAQSAEGAGTVLLDRAALAGRFPFMVTDDVLLAALGTRDEGYFDAATMVSWWRRKARARGVEFVAAEAAGLELAGGRVAAVRLAGGGRVGAGWVVNATGTRAAATAAMAGIALPVEPRRRYTFVFDAAEPLPVRLPLTIDTSGVHVRSDGASYMAGCAPIGPDAACDPADFAAEPDIWEEKAWPAIAARIPAFERVRLRTSWVGHYDYNPLDRNAIVGPAPQVPNFLMMNGFSGHGLQQAPAMGRGIAEWIVHGGYRSLDLSELGMERIIAGRPFAERNVI